MDMDLDDLEAPTKAPPRPTRFAPKNSKIKPKPKAEPPLPPPTSNSVNFPAKEELDSVPPPITSNIIPQIKNEPIAASSSVTVTNGSATVNLDTEYKPEDDEPKEDLMDEDERGEDGEDDYVVREIDVFFSPTVDDNTQVRQYLTLCNNVYLCNVNVNVSIFPPCSFMFYSIR